MLVGYARSSKPGPRFEEQVKALYAAGCVRVFEELPDQNRNQVAFDQMLGYIAPGDTILVEKIGRLSRSPERLVALSETLKAEGAAVRSLREPWVDTRNWFGRARFALWIRLLRWRHRSRDKVDVADRAPVRAAARRSASGLGRRP